MRPLPLSIPQKGKGAKLFSNEGTHRRREQGNDKNVPHGLARNSLLQPSEGVGNTAPPTPCPIIGGLLSLDRS